MILILKKLLHNHSDHWSMAEDHHQVRVVLLFGPMLMGFLLRQTEDCEIHPEVVQSRSRVVRREISGKRIIYCVNQLTASYYVLRKSSQ